MNILVVNIDHVGSLGWYCKRALQKLGHNVSFFDYRKSAYGYSSPSDRLVQIKQILNRIFRLYSITKMNQFLLKKCIAIQPDLILVQKGEIIFADTIINLKKSVHSKIVVWHADNPFASLPTSENIVRSLREYDHCFIFDPSYIPKMESAGAERIDYLTFGCDPEIHKSYDLPNDERKNWGSDICFIGNYQGFSSKRTKLLSVISDFDIRIWGNGWMQLKNGSLSHRIQFKTVYGEEMAKVYNSSKIAINIHHEQSVSGPNMRTFEATACGCFLLTDHVSLLNENFESGVDIVCYSDISDLRNKIKYYLSHPSEREKIARNGQKKCRLFHTYEHRMKKLLGRVMDTGF